VAKTRKLSLTAGLNAALDEDPSNWKLRIVLASHWRRQYGQVWRPLGYLYMARNNIYPMKTDDVRPSMISSGPGLWAFWNGSAIRSRADWKTDPSFPAHALLDVPLFRFGVRYVQVKRNVLEWQVAGIIGHLIYRGDLSF
jgi:hypothetical protein